MNVEKRNVKKNLTIEKKDISIPKNYVIPNTGVDVLNEERASYNNDVIQLLKENKTLIENENKRLSLKNTNLKREIKRLTAENTKLQANVKKLNEKL